jgi:hypothetical protein
LAAECESSSIAERPNLFASPLGEWIVVRSPKRRTSPNLDGPFSGLTNRSSSKGFTSIQPQDDECNSISKPNVYAPDSALELHLWSRVVGQFSSTPTVEQAKQLNKDSDRDTGSCKMPISFLQSCGSYRQLFIYTQMAEDHCPSFYINSNLCVLKLKTKGLLFYSGRAHFRGLNILLSQSLRRREAFMYMYEYSLHKILTFCNLRSEFIVIDGLIMPVTRGPNTKISVYDKEYWFCVSTMLVQICIRNEAGFAFT